MGRKKSVHAFAAKPMTGGRTKTTLNRGWVGHSRVVVVT
jgi:hypothetical protein